MKESIVKKLSKMCRIDFTAKTELEEMNSTVLFYKEDITEEEMVNLIKENYFDSDCGYYCIKKGKYALVMPTHVFHCMFEAED